MSQTAEQLIDRFGRRINYVRFSVTDRCDLRCIYCMSEDMRFLRRSQLLSLEEIALLGHTFSSLGVDKIRITGGEPLVRQNILWLFERLGALPGIRDLSLTTNGTQLPRFAAGLKAAGVKRLNISLDTLRPDLFRRLSRVGELDKVLAGIDAAQAAGFERVKLNSVILKHRNHQEVSALARFALERGLDISFIEEMPLGQVGDHNRAEAHYPGAQILADLRQHFELLPSTETSGGPSRYYRIPGHSNRIGFISPHSHNFCASCNRVRVTAQGQLLLCLGQEHAVDLKTLLRTHPGEPERIRQALRDAMHIKPQNHDFDIQKPAVILRHMNMTGG